MMVVEFGHRLRKELRSFHRQQTIKEQRLRSRSGTSDTVGMSLDSDTDSADSESASEGRGGRRFFAEAFKLADTEDESESEPES
jgi:hypothetical protein